MPLRSVSNRSPKQSSLGFNYISRREDQGLKAESAIRVNVPTCQLSHYRSFFITCPTPVWYWSSGQEWSSWANRMPWVKVLARSSASTVEGIKSLLRVALCHVGKTQDVGGGRGGARGGWGETEASAEVVDWEAGKRTTVFLFKRAPWVPSCPPLLLSTQSSQSLSIRVMTVLRDV